MKNFFSSVKIPLQIEDPFSRCKAIDALTFNQDFQCAKQDRIYITIWCRQGRNAHQVSRVRIFLSSTLHLFCIHTHPHVKLNFCFPLKVYNKLLYPHMILLSHSIFVYMGDVRSTHIGNFRMIFWHHKSLQMTLNRGIEPLIDIVHSTSTFVMTSLKISGIDEYWYSLPTWQKR